MAPQRTPHSFPPGTELARINTNGFTAPAPTSAHRRRGGAAMRAAAGACRSLLIARSRRGTLAQAPARFIVKTCRSLLIPKTTPRALATRATHLSKQTRCGAKSACKYQRKYKRGGHRLAASEKRSLCVF
jgi:hypothetical protein